MEPAIVLVLQLFFADAPPVRAEVPVATIQECVDHIPEFLLMRQFQEKEVTALAAGCFVKVQDRPA